MLTTMNVYYFATSSCCYYKQSFVFWKINGKSKVKLFSNFSFSLCLFINMYSKKNNLFQKFRPVTIIPSTKILLNLYIYLTSYLLEDEYGLQYSISITKNRKIRFIFNSFLSINIHVSSCSYVLNWDPNSDTYFPLGTRAKLDKNMVFSSHC